MPSADLTVHVQPADNGALVRLHGELDLETAPQLEKAITEAAASESAPAAVLVDLTGVTFMDSSGVNALIAARTRLRKAGIRLAVHSPAGTPPRHLIELLGLATPLNVTPAG